MQQEVAALERRLRESEEVGQRMEIDRRVSSEKGRGAAHPHASEREGASDAARQERDEALRARREAQAECKATQRRLDDAQRDAKRLASCIAALLATGMADPDGHLRDISAMAERLVGCLKP